MRNFGFPSYIFYQIEIFGVYCKKYRKTETKTNKRFAKRVSIRHKKNLGDMATQLALQRNFVTITPSQISSNTTQPSHSTATIATPSANSEIVTITDSSSETNNTPIHIMQTHTQVKFLKDFKSYCCELQTILQKKYILQAGTTSDGVSIIDVVPIDQADSPDEAPITVSTILPANSVASPPNNTNSQQITAQVAFVQTQDAAEISESKPQFITVNGKF